MSTNNQFFSNTYQVMLSASATMVTTASRQITSDEPKASSKNSPSHSSVRAPTPRAPELPYRTIFATNHTSNEFCASFSSHTLQSFSMRTITRKPIPDSPITPEEHSVTAAAALALTQDVSVPFQLPGSTDKRQENESSPTNIPIADVSCSSSSSFHFVTTLCAVSTSGSASAAIESSENDNREPEIPSLLHMGTPSVRSSRHSLEVSTERQSYQVTTRVFVQPNKTVAMLRDACMNTTGNPSDANYHETIRQQAVQLYGHLTEVVSDLYKKGKTEQEASIKSLASEVFTAIQQQADVTSERITTIVEDLLKELIKAHARNLELEHRCSCVML